MGRPIGARNIASGGIKELLNAMLPESELKKRWLKWMNHRDPKLAWEAFKLAQAYQFGKPVQPITGDEEAPPIRIDISAIPMKRERA